ncbi:MAG: SNF2-related protein [Mycobacteriales bacterium]
MTAAAGDGAGHIAPPPGLTARLRPYQLRGLGWLTQMCASGLGGCLADEAQAVKNPLSRTARELSGLPAPARVALTGTPVESRLTDLWAILDWTTPGLLGPLERFRTSIAMPVERYPDPARSADLGAGDALPGGGQGDD